jgi:hypothetical protein
MIVVIDGVSLDRAELKESVRSRDLRLLGPGLGGGGGGGVACRRLRTPTLSLGLPTPAPLPPGRVGMT